jgi:ferritin-like metal-binding protein YciE
MAAYGTLIAWANVLGHAEAAKLLDSILREEKADDAKLKKLAEGGINQQAADAAGRDEEDQEEEVAMTRQAAKKR